MAVGFVVVEEARVDEIEDAAKVVFERPVDLDRLDDEVLLAAGCHLSRSGNFELEIGLFPVGALLFRSWGTEIKQKKDNMTNYKKIPNESLDPR